jgi:hypothetical protein
MLSIFRQPLFIDGLRWENGLALLQKRNPAPMPAAKIMFSHLTVTT